MFIVTFVFRDCFGPGPRNDTVSLYMEGVGRRHGGETAMPSANPSSNNRRSRHCEGHARSNLL
jgi:hypothetical protein